MYIDMNFDGLRDDVLTLLIHLGYLGYDAENRCIFIPNNEMRTILRKLRGIPRQYIAGRN